MTAGVATVLIVIIARSHVAIRRIKMMTWNSENECYYERHRLSNGQYCMVAFYRFYRSRSVEYHVVFAVADKKKALNGYFDQTKDNSISLKYTGRCGAEALIWCRDKLLEFENEVFLSDTFETKIVVYGEDHRRFRFYERALTRYGYEKKLTDDGWAMVKKVLRNNYDTEVS